MIDSFNFIKSYLEIYKKILVKNILLKEIFYSLSILILILLISICLTFFFPYPDLFLFLRFFIFILLIFIIIKTFFSIFKVKKLSLEDVACLIEKERKEINNHLINSYQLSFNNNYPVSFINKLRNNTVEIIKNLHPYTLIDKRKLFYTLRIFIISLSLLILSLLFTPDRYKNNLFALFTAKNPSFYIEPGNCEIEKGDNLLIKCFTKSKKTPVIKIRDGEIKTEKMEKHNTFYSYFIPSVKTPFYYRISGENFISTWYYVKIREKTRIKKLILYIKYPEYTKKEKEKKEISFSSFSLFENSKVKMDVFFNNKVGKTFLILSNGEIFLDDGLSSRKTFNFDTSTPVLYEFKFFDPVKKKFYKTERKKIDIIYDSSPFVEIVKPGKDLYGKKKIDIEIVANDDFGIKKVILKGNSGEGEISDKDKKLLSLNLNGIQKKKINFSFYLPEGTKLPFYYYAECYDNKIPSNIGRSSIFYIYPFSKVSEKEKIFEESEKMEEMKKIAEKIKKQLQSFINDEKDLIEAAKKISQIKNLSSEKDLQNIIETQDKYLNIFQKMVNDLDKLGKQTKGEFTLSDELVEMLSHVQKSKENIKKKAIHMAITESQIGLEKAEEITSNLEKWLAEYPDNIKWDLVEPSEEYDVPEAELPDELEDIIGDLIEKEEDMKEEIEDLTSSWMDSLDKGAGWGVSDGPISNMSAKGITGNLMPNQQEIGGRSGEGRTGRSYGEMVEKTATGKGGRKTPARLTPDNLEPGQVQDKSKQSPLGPTGGGKVSGWGPEGLRGPVEEYSFKYDLLAKKQKEIIDKAEKVLKELKIRNVYNPQLERSIKAMKEFQIQLKSGKYKDLMKTKSKIISNLKQANETITKQLLLKTEKIKRNKLRNISGNSFWTDEIPDGYEKVVVKYLKLMSE